MFPANRQLLLDPILAAVKALPGVKSCWQDDFDSNSIRVHVELTGLGHGGSIARKPMRFANTTIRKLKASITKACGERSLTFTRQPTMTYYWCPAVPGDKGRKEKDGYDGDMLSFDVRL